MRQQVPSAYIHIYEHNQECYNIILMSLGQLPFYFLFQTYLLLADRYLQLFVTKTSIYDRQASSCFCKD